MAESFTEGSRVTVVARLALYRAVDTQWIDAPFERHHERQDTCELLFPISVDLTSVMVVDMQPSLHAAAKSTKDPPVSIAALNGKVICTELGLMRALVSGSSQRL